MQCRSCNYPESRVIYTKPDDRLNQIIRRRECIKCGVRYTTQENMRDIKEKSTYKTTPPRQVLER
jgi:transcriptional repressor NrdR